MGLITKTVKVKWNGKTKKHYEDLGYNFTKISDEFEVRVEDLPKTSRASIECVCDNCKGEILWTYEEYNRYVKEDKNTYCKKCSYKIFGKTKEIKTRLLKGKSFYEWCIENNRQDVLDRWDYELNDCSPKDVLYKSKVKYWFKCNKHKEHKSELKNIQHLTDGLCNLYCIQCRSIAQWLIDIYGENALKLYWDYEKNGDLDPWTIKSSSHIKIWIKCKEKDYHGSYEIQCDNFTKHEARCPYCNKNSGKVHPLDSLGQYIINNYGEEFLYKIWSDKNTISPFKICPKSNKKVWWNCLNDKHKTFKRTCNSSIEYSFRCPECIKENEESIIEKNTKHYLEELGYEVKTEHNCSLIPKNPKTKCPLPFDNEIVLENGKHLIIEVHGVQHYKLQTKNSKYLKKGQTPEEFLHQRKLYDRYKRIKCIQAGYYYLEIPHKVFDKKETYKNLIDNKIKEILES